METIEEIQTGHLNPITQIFFRAGVLACREYMARFVEPQNPLIAQSIRANWFPSLGEDFGPPRQLEWNELTEGEYGTEEFREKTAKEVSPTQEALPVALAFLNGTGIPDLPPCNQKDVAELARKFVHQYETWEGYQSLAGSNSASLPVEFVALCEAVESVYGAPKGDDENA